MINVKALPIVDALTSNGQPLVAILGPNHEVYWEAVKKMEGILPLIFESRKGGPLKEYKIYGNTPYQEWTPSPEKERTANLLDIDDSAWNGLHNGVQYSTDNDIVRINGTSEGGYRNRQLVNFANNTYTLSVEITGTLNNEESHTFNLTVNGERKMLIFSKIGKYSLKVTGEITDLYTIINVNFDGDIYCKIMLNEGSSALPYEPYGYRENTGPCEVKGVGERTGNLLSLYSFDRQPTIDGDTISFTATGNFQARGTTLKRVYDKYTLSLKDCSAGCRLEVRYLLNDVVNPSFVDICTVTHPVVLRTNIEYDTVDIKLSNSNMGAGTFYFSGIMLNEGSEPLPYEPYGYKTTVVDEGKNLLNSTAYETTYAYDDKTILNTINSLPIGIYRISIKFKLISRRDISDESRYGVITIPAIISAKPSWGTSDVGEERKFTVSLTISPTNVGKFEHFYIYGCGNDKVGTTGKAEVSEFQIERGTTATEYAPYREPIETTIYHDEPYFTNDYIRKDKDGGVEHREWNKIAFNGSESWYDGDKFIYLAVPGMLGSQTGLYAKNTHFIVNISGSYTRFMNVNGVLRLYNYSSNANEFKSFLKSEYDAGRPVTVYYPLQTPTDTPKDLPDIVTASGYNSIDTDTQIKPEKMEIAYR